MIRWVEKIIIYAIFIDDPIWVGYISFVSSSNLVLYWVFKRRDEFACGLKWREKGWRQFMADESMLYLKVERELRAAIQRGEFRVGCKLPNERELAGRFGVSRTTVRLAMNPLRQSGLLRSERGKYGVFLSEMAAANIPTPSQAIASQPRFLHIVAVHCQPYRIWEMEVIRMAQESAGQAGWRVCPHWFDSLEDARKLVMELDSDPTVVGGVLVGGLTSAQAAGLTAGSRLAWVRMGDFVENTRRIPVIDQVLGDNYAFTAQVTRDLVELGCRHPAMLLFDRNRVWSREAISAYRSVLDAAGIPPDNQQILDMVVLRAFRSSATSEDNERRNLRAIHRAFAYWRQTDRWPDAIFLWGQRPEIMDNALRADATARERLADVRMAVLSSEQTKIASIHHHSFLIPIRWYLFSMREMADLAVAQMDARQREPGKPGRDPRREYVRTLKMEQTFGTCVEVHEHLEPEELARLVVA